MSRKKSTTKAISLPERQEEKDNITYLSGISRVFRPLFSVQWLKTFFRWISLISLCFLSVFLSLFCFLRIFCQFVLWAISLHFNIIIYFSVNQGLNSKDLRANGFSDGLWQHVIFEGFCGFIHAIFQETSTIKNWRIPSGPNTSTHFFF